MRRVKEHPGRAMMVSCRLGLECLTAMLATTATSARMAVNSLIALSITIVTETRLTRMESSVTMATTESRERLGILASITARHATTLGSARLARGSDHARLAISALEGLTLTSPTPTKYQLQLTLALSASTAKKADSRESSVHRLLSLSR